MSYTNLPASYPRRVLTNYSFLDASHLFTPTADQKYPLGQILDLPDGRRFRYCKAGAALTAGQINQQAVGTANWQNEAQTNNPDVPALGDTEITITLTGTATKDQFAGAYLTVEDGTGEGQMYLIASNKAGTANATTGYDIVCQLADEGGIRIALAASSEVTVTLNKYMDVIVFPTDPTGVCTGVNPSDVTDDYYFWSQTHGPAAVVNGSDTIVVGDTVCAGGQAAGVASLPDNGTASEGDTIIGHAMRAAGSGETCLVDLNIE